MLHRRDSPLSAGVSEPFLSLFGQPLRVRISILGVYRQPLHIGITRREFLLFGYPLDAQLSGGREGVGVGVGASVALGVTVAVDVAGGKVLVGQGV